MLKRIVQVQTFTTAMRGETSEKGGVLPYYMGMRTRWEDGCVVAPKQRSWRRMGVDKRLALSCEYGLPAYKVGINVVIYAMSH